MQVTQFVEAIEESGRRLAAAATEAGPGAPVPPCPGWTVADLVVHTGGVHRWAASYVRTGRGRATTAAEEEGFFAAPPGDLVAWFSDGVAALALALRAAPADLECWTFLPAPSPLAFWARRQAHETTVHAADALAAAGKPAPVGPALGADGLDELLGGFFARPGRGPSADPARSLELRASDVGRTWTLEIGPEGPAVVEARAGADCTIEGRAGDLYLAMWNRRPAGELVVSGDVSALERWHAGAAVTWS